MRKGMGGQLCYQSFSMAGSSFLCLNWHFWQTALFLTYQWVLSRWSRVKECTWIYFFLIEGTASLCIYVLYIWNLTLHSPYICHWSDITKILGTQLFHKQNIQVFGLFLFSLLETFAYRKSAEIISKKCVHAILHSCNKYYVFLTASVSFYQRRTWIIRQQKQAHAFLNWVSFVPKIDIHCI